MLRFVLLKYGDTQSILVSTCLDLTPETIIRLYSYRFRIEGCFRELKQQIRWLWLSLLDTGHAETKPFPKEKGA